LKNFCTKFFCKLFINLIWHIFQTEYLYKIIGWQLFNKIQA